MWQSDKRYAEWHMHAPFFNRKSDKCNLNSPKLPSQFQSDKERQFQSDNPLSVKDTVKSLMLLLLLVMLLLLLLVLLMLLYVILMCC